MNEPPTYWLPKFDGQTLKVVLTGTVPGQEYVTADYNITAKPGIPLVEAMARAAIVASARSQRPYLHESKEEWLRRSARITNTADGYCTIAYPIEIFGPRDGVANLLAILTCGAEHDFVEEFWLHRFELPPCMLDRFDGPKFGLAGIRERMGVENGPIIGVTMRPVLAQDKADEDLSQYRAALMGGADYIADDILFSDGVGDWDIETRAKRLVELCKSVEKATKKRKSYVVNVGLRDSLVADLIERLHVVGVAAVKVNAFFAGFGTLQTLSQGSSLPVIATNIGVSLLTRPANVADKKLGTGVSEMVISKISRLCGADGVHLGSVDTGSFVVQPYDPAILVLASPLGKYKTSIAVLGDNVHVGNLWQNLRNFGRDVMIESSTGIMSYPGGPEKGAAMFRNLATKLADIDDDKLAHQTLISMAATDRYLKTELEGSGYIGSQDV